MQVFSKLLLVVCCIFPAYLMAQVAVNNSWIVQEGEPDSVAWSASVIDQFGNVITTGNSTNQQGNADIHVQKVDMHGNVVWTLNHDYTGGNDYGVALVLDNIGDVYVCGAGWNSTPQNFDIVLLRVSQTGQLQWSNSYNGPAIWTMYLLISTSCQPPERSF